MEKCILFVCWSIVSGEGLKPPGTVLWQGNGWDVVHVIRNNDTTDPGCRLSRANENGGKLEFDAHFIAGRVSLEFAEVLPMQGEANLMLVGLFGDDESWGGSISAEITSNQIEAMVPGMAIPDLLLEWSERGVQDLALFDIDAEKWLTKIAVPGLPEATAAFMECYNALP